MNRKYYCWFVVMLIAQIAIFSYIFSIKPDLFQDEFWTFNFANANYTPLMWHRPELYNNWLPQEYWRKLLTVQPGEGFNYGAVTYNTAIDVHPPIYYYLIHTICSFFPNSFNPWLGFLPNIIFFVGTQAFVLLLGKELGQDNIHRLMPCLIYGFSIGAIQNVTFIRMYMLLTFLCTMSMWLHIKLFQKKKKYCLFLISCIHIIGFLTQYYYLLFATAEYLMLSYYSLAKKQLREWFAFTITNCFSLAVAVAMFPACLEHIMGHGANGYRGAEIIKNLGSFTFLEHLVKYLKLLVSSEAAIIYMLTIIFVVAVHIITDKKSKYVENHKIDCLGNFCLFTALITFLIVVKISQIIFVRYLFMIIPVLVVGVYFLYIKLLVQNYGLKQKIAIACICFVTFLQLGAIRFISLERLLDIGNDKLPVITEEWIEKEQVKQSVTVIFSEDYGFVICSLGLLRQMPYSYVIMEKDLAALERLKLDDKLIVNYDSRNKMSLDQFLELCKTKLGYNNIKVYKTHGNYGWNCFLSR